MDTSKQFDHLGTTQPHHAAPEQPPAGQPIGQPQNAGQPTTRRVRHRETGEERVLSAQEFVANEAQLRRDGFVPIEETDERLPTEKVPHGQGVPDGFSNGTTKVVR